MRNVILTFACLASFATSPSRAPGADAPPPRELWLYQQTNLQVDANVDKLRDVWTRAAKAGYTHVLLADSKMAKLGDLGGAERTYRKNAERAKQIAAELKLALVPALFHVGYSNSMLWHDPSLAEGLPVRDALFVVGPGGEAKLTPDPKPELGKVGFKDKNVAIDGGVATVTPDGNVARFNYKLAALPPYRAYHVSVKVKTDDYRGKPEVKAIAAGKPGRVLQWENLGAKRTQDWTEHHVVFNTLDSAGGVTLYFGDWSAKTGGTLQWKDWAIEEAGLVNVLRRPGTPLVVKGEDGVAYAEGKDFEAVADPHLGNEPWKGQYQPWHKHGPPALRTKLKEGTRLRVSWYHPAVIYDGQVSACVAEQPRMNDLLADEARRVREMFPAAGYMMSHDEYRTLGWCGACDKSGKSPGQLIAENARYCAGLLKPATAYVWNDMFDPHHNAVGEPYYLVKGSWAGAWDGLDKDVVVVNWNYGKRDASLKFFADRGHRQVIAGFYESLDRTPKWLESASKVKGVVGVMYTTWVQDFTKIEAFAEQCRAWRSAE